jgi:class 3 adenylate cyclase
MSGATLPRGTVTFLFSDVEGSTDLIRAIGAGAFASIRAEHRRLLREVFDTHGGREIDTAGDGFFVAFESARAAVAAAVDGQVALASFTWPAHAAVRVRMGLHTAEPHLGADGYVGIGVHRAARICSAARGGQILVSNATAGIVEDAELPGVELVDLGEHRLKGLTQKQRLFQLTVLRLPSEFGPLRTPDTEARVPGAGTFLMADLSNSRRVIRVLGDEASAELIADYQKTVAALIEANDGIVLERVADNVLGVFRSASDAVRTATAVRDSVHDLDWPVECDVTVSIVLHSGRWSGDPHRPSAGTAMFRLGRIAEMVEPGQVLVSPATAALLEGDRQAPPLRSLGERAVPDFDEPMVLYELTTS